MQVDEPPLLDEKESDDRKQLSASLNQLAGRINGALGKVDWMPIHYTIVPQDETSLVALVRVGVSSLVSLVQMRLADAGCFSPLRDGMNIPCLEFIICQKNKCAPLILSEFAGAAQSLSGAGREKEKEKRSKSLIRSFPGALLINPWNISDMADSFNEALMLSEADKRLKHHYNYEYTIRHTGFFWAKTFLQELLRIAPEITLPLLSFVQVKRAYEQAEARLILLDYDGLD